MAKRTSKKDYASIVMWADLIAFPGWIRGKELQFFPPRRWRFDFVLINEKLGDRIAIEIEGGVWIKGGGGHNRGKAFVDDMEKYNYASLQRWRLLRFTPAQVLDGTAFAFLVRVVNP